MANAPFSPRRVSRPGADAADVADEAARAMRLTIDSQDAGRFEIVGELARGGMGRIMEAWDPRHERKVAIKLLLQRSEEASRRFAREARITARLQHPSIVPLYESGSTPTGEPFVAMKLVDGRSLASTMATAKTLEERLALLPNLIAVSDALAYAHARRIIHRDLKPSNVLLGSFGETIVIDWGLAKDLAERGDDGMATAITRGRPIGTPRYMPPEQARGEPTDERSDVYALGALLYHVLGGVAPYRELTARQALEEVCVRPTLPLDERDPRLPRELVAIVSRAMARDPEHRYPSARELAEDLKRFSAGQLAAAKPARVFFIPRARRLTVRVVASLAAAVALAIAVGVALVILASARERDRSMLARLAAEHDRRSAEDLAAFVLRDVGQRLAQDDSLETLAEAARVSVAHYARSFVPPDAQALNRRALALELSARIAEQRGAASEPAWREAASLRARALALSPDDDDALEAAAVDAMHLALFEQAIDAADKLRARGADDPHRRRLGAEARSRFATHIAVSDPTRARGLYAGARGLLLPVAYAENPSAEARMELARVDVALVACDMDLGDIPSARAHQNEAVAMRRAIVAASPDDKPSRAALADAERVLGEIERRR